MCTVGELLCTIGQLFCTLGELFCTAGKLFCNVRKLFCTLTKLFWPKEAALAVAVLELRVGKDPFPRERCCGGCRTPKRLVLAPLGFLCYIGRRFSKGLCLLILVLNWEICASSHHHGCFRSGRRLGSLEARTGSCAYSYLVFPDSEASSYGNPATDRGEVEIPFQGIHYSSPADELSEIEAWVPLLGPRRRSCDPFAIGSRDELYWPRRVLGSPGCGTSYSVYGATGCIQTCPESHGFRGRSLSGGSFRRRTSLRNGGTSCSSTRSSLRPSHSVFDSGSFSFCTSRRLVLRRLWGRSMFTELVDLLLWKFCLRTSTILCCQDLRIRGRKVFRPQWLQMWD